MLEDFALFFIVGMIAQFVDGALGMAYGVTASSFLLAAGVAPAHASAGVHFAKFFTTGVSGLAHATYKNVDWGLFWRLAVAGALGGIGGAYVLTSVDGAIIKPFIVVYLAVMGIVILRRMLNKPVAIKFTSRTVMPVGVVGGFLDAIGGGGWGPIVTTSLIGRGGDPRFVIGSVNASEFVVTVAVGAALIAAFVSGRWADGGELVNHAAPIAGLIAGGLISAPIAGKFVSVIPRQVLGVSVGILILGLSGYQALALAHAL
ncbi:MAG: sulfite exporter TauE/SafE family protein [Micropepsaceae bacterium]